MYRELNECNAVDPQNEFGGADETVSFGAHAHSQHIVHVDEDRTVPDSAQAFTAAATDGRR